MLILYRNHGIQLKNMSAKKCTEKLIYIFQRTKVSNLMLKTWNLFLLKLLLFK